METREAYPPPPAAVSRLKGGVTGLRAILRNIAFIFASFLATWVVSLLYWLVVPRIIGPTGWGEYNLGLAIAGIAFTTGGLGITTFLVKGIARENKHSSELVSSGISTHLVLAIFITAAVFLFTEVMHYSAHTRVVILLMSGVSLTAFLVAPTFSALQGLEKMRLASVVYALRQVAPTLAAVLVALTLRLEITGLVAVILIANVVVSLLQLGVANRIVPIKLSFNLALSRRLITSGLPFWSNGVFLTIYVAIASVLLSTLASTREVGYYAAPGQVISTLGFLPAIVTFAIFPALSSSFQADFERLRQLTRMSLSVLISLGLPISIGAALVGPNAIQLAFGPAFRPSGPTMVVLALTVLPSYIATLAYYVLAAADQQRKWAYVMGAMAFVNPVINLFAIPYCQARFGHGSIGAAIALLITDLVVCVAGLALMPRACLTPARPLLAVTARTALATIAMAIPVWFLRDRFLPLPVITGIGIFVAVGFATGAFRGEGYQEAVQVLKSGVRRRFLRRAEEVMVPAQTPDSDEQESA